MIDRVSKGRGPVVITKRGKPVVMLVAAEDKQRGSLFGFAKGYMKVHGDIMAPIEVEWEAGTRMLLLGTHVLAWLAEGLSDLATGCSLPHRG